MSKPFLIVVFLSAVMAGAACASETLPDLEEARALADRAKQLRQQAEADLRQTEPVCYERFLVNRCLDQARSLRLERIKAARALEIESRRIELTHKRMQAEADSIDQGVTSTAGDIPAQTVIPEPSVDAATLYIRAQREAQHREAEVRQRSEQAQQEADLSESRERAEAGAARRAEQAERDRQRYDDRLQ